MRACVDSSIPTSACSRSWTRPTFSLTGLFIAGVATLLGEGSVAGTLLIARQAEGPDQLESGAEIDEIGLTEDEAAQLLGR